MNYNLMLIVAASWRISETETLPTFKLIPTSVDCPYNEVIYDPQNRTLGIISKEHKPKLQFLARIDEIGNVKYTPTRRNEEPQVMRQRTEVDTYYEYFIEQPADIIDFVEQLASNPDHVEFRRHFQDPNEYQGTVAEPGYSSQISGRGEYVPERSMPGVINPELIPDEPLVAEALAPSQSPENQRPITD